MSWILGTTHRTVRWYVFREGIYGRDIAEGQVDLHDKLDLDVVPQFADKEQAKAAAKRLGLTTWIYVRL